MWIEARDWELYVSVVNSSNHDEGKNDDSVSHLAEILAHVHKTLVDARRTLDDSVTPDSIWKWIREEMLVCSKSSKKEKSCSTCKKITPDQIPAHRGAAWLHLDAFFCAAQTMMYQLLGELNDHADSFWWIPSFRFPVMQIIAKYISSFVWSPFRNVYVEMSRQSGISYVPVLPHSVTYLRMRFPSESLKKDNVLAVKAIGQFFQTHHLNTFVVCNQGTYEEQFSYVEPDGSMVTTNTTTQAMIPWHEIFCHVNARVERLYIVRNVHEHDASIHGDSIALAFDKKEDQCERLTTVTLSNIQPTATLLASLKSWMIRGDQTGMPRRVSFATTKTGGLGIGSVGTMFGQHSSLDRLLTRGCCHFEFWEGLGRSTSLTELGVGAVDDRVLEHLIDTGLISRLTSLSIECLGVSTADKLATSIIASKRLCRLGLHYQQNPKCSLGCIRLLSLLFVRGGHACDEITVIDRESEKMLDIITKTQLAMPRLIFDWKADQTYQLYKPIYEQRRKQTKQSRELWKAIAFCIAFLRANQNNPLRLSGLALAKQFEKLAFL